MHENKQSSEKQNFEESILRTILLRTLSLLAEMNVLLRNFPEAKKAIRDLE